MALISLQGSNQTWDCEEGDTILRSAQRAGLAFPYECNVGSCGTCKFDIIAGAVDDLRPDAPGLNERDRTRGKRLACQSRPTSDCTVKARLLPQYQPRIIPVKRSTRLVSVTPITHDIREFRFELDAEMPFLPGQYALLEIAGVVGARAYSMSNTPRAGKEWHFQIKRVPGGAATQALFEKLAVGDTLTIDGPYGMAYLREEIQREIVCIAGGSGLAPMISIARAAAVASSLHGQRLDFLYGGRAERDICGRDMLEVLPGFGANIHYHPAISAPPEASDAWSGYRGFVHDLADELIGTRLASCEIYFAGPPMMGDAVLKMLVARGVPGEQIHFDRFY